MTGPHVQVIASGAATRPVADIVADLVVCADGGVAVALASGRTVDLVVGDLDSAEPSDLATVEAAGGTIVGHPVDKDESDLELALAVAAGRGAARITVHLGEGGRLDHQLANLMVLASSRWSPTAIDAWVGHDRVWVVRDELETVLPVGELVGIQAVGGSARVTTEGLAYPLHDERLAPTEARGIANRVLASPVRIEVRSGVVLVIRPGGQSAHAT